MSQAGKVLQLYVEVRPVAEEDGPAGGGQLTLQRPEALPGSRRSSTRPASCYSPAPSPAPSPHLQRPNSCVSPSKSPRQSVTFQLQNPQLLQVLAPQTAHQSGQQGPAAPSWPEWDPKPGRALRSPSPAPSGRMTSPPSRRLEPDGGQTSLVTYGYIEKSHVHTLGAHRAPVGRREPDGAFLTPTQKRLSDPLGFPSPHPCLPPHDLPQWCWSYTQGAANGAVPREARTLEEFTPPMLRRRHGGYNPSPTLPGNYQSPRCRSWGGSPVLPRGSLTLPSKAQPGDPDRGLCRASLPGLPRSPASDRLCAHTQHPPCSVNVHYQSPVPGAQRSQVTEEGPRLASRFYPPLPAGRPTDIQHQLWLSSRGRLGPQPCGYYSYPDANDANRGRCATDGLCYSVSDDLASRSQYSSWRCGRTGTAASPSSSRRSISPSSNHEAAGKRAYASQLTADFGDRTTPSPSSSPAESHRSESPNTEGTRLAPYASLLGPRSPEQDRRRRAEQTPPLTRPGRISPAPPKSQSPVLDLHRQRAPSPGRNHPWQGSHRGPERSPGNHEWRGSGRVQPGDKDRQSTQTQLLDPTGSGASSLSSSGVTGSVGDSSHPSPETSSQSSQDTSGAGSAMQVGGWGGRPLLLWARLALVSGFR